MREGDVWMSRRKKWLCVVTAAALLLGGVRASMPVLAQESGGETKTVRLAEEEGVTVTSRE